MGILAQHEPWAWAVLAIILAMLELQMPGAYLIWVACGAALTSAAVFLVQWSIQEQLAIFAGASVVSCLIGIFVYRRFSSKTGDEILNRRDRAMLGALGVTAGAFVNGQGRVRIGDTVWLSQSTEDLPANTPIIVQAVHGTTVIVERR